MRFWFPHSGTAHGAAAAVLRRIATLHSVRPSFVQAPQRCRRLSLKFTAPQ